MSHSHPICAGEDNSQQFQVTMTVIASRSHQERGLNMYWSLHLKRQLSHTKAIPASGSSRDKKVFCPTAPLGISPSSPCNKRQHCPLLSGTGNCQSLCLQRECRGGGKQVPHGKIINTHSEEVVTNGFRYPGRIEEETCSPNNCIHLRTSKPALLSTLPQNLPPTITRVI